MPASKLSAKKDGKTFECLVAAALEPQPWLILTGETDMAAGPQYISGTTAAILGAGGLYLYRDEVSRNARKLGNYALERPFGTAVTLGVGSIVGMKALGLIA